MQIILPFLPVSSETGEGISEIRAIIEELVGQEEEDCRRLGNLQIRKLPWDGAPAVHSRLT